MGTRRREGVREEEKKAGVNRKARQNTQPALPKIRICK